MGDLSRRQIRHWRRRTSGSGNAREVHIRRRDDVPVVAPSAAIAQGDRAQLDYLAGLQRDLLEAVACKEGDPLPVRREEGRLGPFRSRQLGGSGLIEGPDEELRLGLE